MIIDTHVHLNDPRLIDNLDEIIKEAKEHDVGKMIVIGYDYASSQKAIEIAHTYPQVFAAIGIHPSEVLKANKNHLAWLNEGLKDEKVVAIGEIGLDYYWDKSFKDEQIAYLKAQLEIAKLNRKPVIIHARDATNDIYECLKDSGVVGVMHCYSGSLEMAERFIKLGFYLGIGGVLTFKNSHLKDVVKAIPLEYLLSETDAPYLAPDPFRGKTNYPKYTEIVVNEIARIKDLDLNIVKQKLCENSNKLFNI